jgi:hydroxybutyrate-dimer hydrolase
MRNLVLACGVAFAFGANAWADDDEREFIRSPIPCIRYDGVGDDLLTAGLGKSGLQSVTPPAVAVPASPTAAELRRLAIYNNYRALADMSTSGGYGVLYGPNIDLDGRDTLGEGKVAGEECIAYADDGTGRQNVTMMVQIPASFDPRNACIVAGPSSGSRGVYGAIGTTGEWALKRGCAVAYTDKGTGNGAHDLQNNTVNLIDGRRADAGTAGRGSNFTARLSETERAAFNAASPHRFAYKHAHSELNPEKDWGAHVLMSIEFAFHVLNQRFGHVGHEDDDDDGGGLRRITKHNTIVIASSVSNGGGASLAAAEQDKRRLIDGVVVSEPQVQPRPNPKLTIKRGTNVIAAHGKGLYDYITLANLFQPCAALAPANAGAPAGFFVVQAFAANRCAALRANGLLTADMLVDQAEEAQSVLNDNGWEPESNILGPSHYGFQVAPAVAVTYANAHGRFRVLDNACGFSMGGTTGAGGTPGPVAATAVAQIFATGNGVPPTSGINLINNANPAGPLNDPISSSASTGRPDYNFDGAWCLRKVFSDSKRVRSGIAQVNRNGNLRGTPAIIVHGRADNLVPVNHSSRPYYGLNKMVEGGRSKLRYYEVTNAQHFEAFINPALVPGTLFLAGYDTRFIPLHVYGIQALNLMYEHLKYGARLPDSQVVRTIPRGGVPGMAPPITSANVPPIAQHPASGERIRFHDNTLHIPD